MNPPVPNPWDRRISLALAVYSLLIAIWLSRHSVQVTQEDGYYYYKLAQQMAAGKGATFDGLHSTNGYHPLWLLCLLPIFRFTPVPETALVLGVLLQGILMAACGVLVYRTARIAVGPSAAALASLLWIGLTYREAVSGLEFSLHALCILAAAHFYLYRFCGEGAPTTSSSWTLGLLLGLAFLARLDTLLLAVILGACLLARMRPADASDQSRSLPSGRMQQAASVRWELLLAYGLPVVALSLIYVGINFMAFGHSVPVSGFLKREWSAALLEQDTLYRTHGWLAAKGAHLFWPLQDLKTRYPIAVGVYLAPLLLVLTRTKPGTPQKQGRGATPAQTQFFLSLGPFIIYSVAQFVVTALLYHGDLSEKPWYYVVQPWLTALLTGWLFQKVVDFRTLSRRLDARLPVFLGAALFLAGGAIPFRTLLTLRHWEKQTRNEHQELIETAYWLRANLPQEAIIGTWNAGTIGFLSRRQVVNLDGLENSWDYALVAHRDLCDYFGKTGITYLADAFENGEVMTRAQGFTDFTSCEGAWERIWSDNRSGTSWHMEVYQHREPSRMETREKR